MPFTMLTIAATSGGAHTTKSQFQQILAASAISEHLFLPALAPLARHPYLAYTLLGVPLFTSASASDSDVSPVDTPQV